MHRYPMLGLIAAFVNMVGLLGVTLEWAFAGGRPITVAAMASATWFAWLWAQEQMR
jgi:hypothetical protein